MNHMFLSSRAIRKERMGVAAGEKNEGNVVVLASNTDQR